MTRDIRDAGPVRAAGNAPTSKTVRRRRRTVLLVTAGALLLAGVCGRMAWARHSTSARIDAVAAVTAADVAEWKAGDSRLDAAVLDARDLLAAADGKVADPATLTTLSAAVHAADGLAAPSLVPEGANLDAAHGWQLAASRALARQTTAAADLATASAAVTESMAAFELDLAVDALTGARDQLGTAIDAGKTVLAASEGKVADNQVRQGLRDALDGAIAAHEIEPSTHAELADVQAHAMELTEHRGKVEGAGQVVTDAQTAWQAEQDRKAEEAAAAAAAAEQEQEQEQEDPAAGDSSRDGETSSPSSGSSRVLPRNVTSSCAKSQEPTETDAGRRELDRE